MADMDLDVTFRVASKMDAALVVQLISELVDELGPPDVALQVKILLDDDVKLAFASERVRVFVAEVDGEPVGLARCDVLTSDPIFRLRPDHRCGYVDQMFVRPTFRNRGIGARLIQMCEAWLRGQGISHALLHAAVKAVPFYVREGYQPNREMFKRL